jgi:hypothetical protein
VTPWQTTAAALALGFVLGCLVTATATDVGRPRVVLQACDEGPGASWL